MSILIKGMTMPKNCWSCPFRKFWDDEDQCLAKKNLWVKGNEIPPVCPLVELPPHGDLIDRNTAYDSILNGMVMTGYQSRALDCISEYSVPTIIESEEGKDNAD